MDSEETFYLISSNDSIKINSPYYIKKHIENIGYHVLPDLKINEVHNNNFYEISFYEEKIKSFQYNDKNAILTGEYKQIQMAYDILMLSSRLFEHEYRKQDKISFHSTAISNNKEALIITGTAHSGKTTLAMKACENKLKFISGERSLIDMSNNYVVGGTTKNNIRVGSIIRDFPKYLYMVDDLSGDPWEKKLSLNCEELNFEKSKLPLPIKTIIFPKETNMKLEAHSLKDMKSVARIHEQLSHFETFPSLLLGQETLVPDYITNSDKKQGIEYTKKICNEIELISLCGSFDDMDKWINDYMKGD